MSFAQGVAFKKVNEFYLKGDTRVIGNTILGDHPTRAYVRPKGLNDRTEMVYVDVDKNAATFSSSSATLTMPKDATIKYAGLYWAATYPGERGKQRVRNDRIEYKLNTYHLVHFDGPHMTPTVVAETVFFAQRSVVGSIFIFDDWQTYDSQLVKNVAPKSKIKSFFILFSLF